MASRCDLRGLRPLVSEFLVYMVAVLVVLGLLGVLSGLSPGARDLVDSDGYMRFLRIRQLADGGEWFNPVFGRSNYPFGETLHWTRPLDVYVIVLGVFLRPFLGTESLYWAAFINGPLLLIALGPLTYWAVGWLCRPAIRSVLMPALLGLPLVIAYFGFGRVDHHGPILLIFIWVLGLLLRVMRQPGDRTVVLLGAAMGLGIWVSVEFLVPWGLVAACLGIASLRRDGTELTVAGAIAFAVTAITTLAASLVERGSFVLGFDRISFVHGVVAATGCLVFMGLVAVLRSRLSGLGQIVGVAVVVLSGGLLLVLLFPDLTGGPFVQFDPVVRQRWLSNVTELLPISGSEGPGLILFRVAPLLLGGLAWFGAQKQMSGGDLGPISVLAGWLLGYSVLALAQFRWVLFGHGLALLLVLIAIGPLYERLGCLRLSVLLRPLAIAVFLAMPLLGAGWSDASTTNATTRSDCALEDGLPALSEKPVTTVLADADVGPEILYRTDHNVIATPYGNAAALTYLFETMAEIDLDAVRDRLADRSVGLILVCSTRSDLMRPLEPASTFYEAMVMGYPLDFLEAIPLVGATDYLLYEVDL